MTIKVNETKSELDLLREQLAEQRKQTETLKALIESKFATSNAVPAMDMSKLVSDAVMATIIAQNKANREYDAAQQEQLVRERLRKSARCGVCGLLVTACGGAYSLGADGKPNNLDKQGNPIPEPDINHIKAYVGPRDEDLFQWFQGIVVSGVRFLSDWHGHQIWVPKKSDILASVMHWEKNEKELSKRRRASGQGFTGAMGSSEGSYKQAPGWR